MVEHYAAAGVPVATLTLGLAFFGKIWQGGEGTPTGGVTAPRQKWTAKPTLSGEYQYHQIVARADFAGNDHWDAGAQTPYLGVDRPGAAADLFLPYENAKSIAAKVDFAAAVGLGGVMIWELRGDYLPDRSHPLIAALKAAYRAHHGTSRGRL
jgi:chitinase